MEKLQTNLARLHLGKTGWQKTLQKLLCIWAKLGASLIVTIWLWTQAGLYVQRTGELTQCMARGHSNDDQCSALGWFDPLPVFAALACHA